MLILFEDNANKATSQLLRHNPFSIPVEFSGGAALLQQYIQQNIQSDALLVLIDVVPDNENTISLFVRLRQQYKHRNNVYIVPMICMEYCILKFLLTYGYIKKTVQLSSLFPPYTSYKNMAASLEKQCKQYFGSLTAMSYCLKNVITPNIQGAQKYGLFYTQDCSCTNCRLRKQATLHTKAQQLYYSLPVVLDRQGHLCVVQDTTGVLQHITYPMVLQQQQRFYDTLSIGTGLPRIEIK